MAQVIVKHIFRDKNTGMIHKQGDVLDLDKKRIDEILSVGNFIEEKAKNEKAASK